MLQVHVISVFNVRLACETFSVNFRLNDSISGYEAPAERYSTASATNTELYAARHLTPWQRQLPLASFLYAPRSTSLYLKKHPRHFRL